VAGPSARPRLRPRLQAGRPAAHGIRPNRARRVKRYNTLKEEQEEDRDDAEEAMMGIKGVASCKPHHDRRKNEKPKTVSEAEMVRVSDLGGECSGQPATSPAEAPAPAFN